MSSAGSFPSFYSARYELVQRRRQRRQVAHRLAGAAAPPMALSMAAPPESSLARYFRTQPVSRTVRAKLVIETDSEGEDEEEQAAANNVVNLLFDTSDDEKVASVARPTAAAAPPAPDGSHDDPIVLDDTSDEEVQVVDVKVVDDVVEVDDDEVDDSDDEELSSRDAWGRLPRHAHSRLVTPQQVARRRKKKRRLVSSESSFDASSWSSSPNSVYELGKKERRFLPQRQRYTSSGSEEDSDSSSEGGHMGSDESSESSDEESVDSVAAANEFLASPCPVGPDERFSLPDFKHLWRLAELRLGETTEDIESGRRIRAANASMVSGDTTGQDKAQYGRILPDATQLMLLEVLQVSQDDVFVDIGHGIGNTVLQAAYTIGCESRGIEVVKDRDVVSREIAATLQTILDVRRETHGDPRVANVGQVDLRHGRLEVPENRDFLINPGKVTKAFVNNFDGVFAHRSTKNGQTYWLDNFVAALFASMAPGSKMVTLHPLDLGNPPTNEARERRLRHGFHKTKLASFYTMETATLGEAKDAVSWSQGGSNAKEITVYVYTRVPQRDGGPAVFLCGEPTCERAQANEPQSAVNFIDYEGGERMVIGRCSCGLSARPVRQRTRVNYNGDGAGERIMMPYG